jgi:glycosyltransferase involved in cell wall biosynthesis
LNEITHAVDVLLPVYNGAATIAESVKSIMAQSVRSICIIVVDDGSTDNTPKILQSLALEEPRLLVLTKSNSGIVDTLNLGLRSSRAEFLARHDADDVSDPTRLETQMNYLMTHPNCVAVSAAARHINKRGEPTGHVAYVPTPDLADPYSIPSKEPYLLHPFLMVRRSTIETVGGYRHVHHSEDTDLYWRLFEHGSMHNLSIPLGSYRMHNESISASIVNGRIMALSSQLAALSERRRRRGHPDISFARHAIDEYHHAEGLKQIYDLGRRSLDADETRYLRSAVSAKLLQMAAYRPYVLNADDCRFIRDAYIEAARSSTANLSDFRFLLTTMVAHLVRRGYLKEAACLVPPALRGEAIARTIATSIFPDPIYGSVLRLLKRSARAQS